MQVTDSAPKVSAGLHNNGSWTRPGSLLITFALGVANIAIAGTNSWTPLGPSGGSVYDIEFHPTDAATMYVATSNGFYRSTDSATSWQQTSTAGLPIYFRPTGLAVDPVHPDRVLVASAYTSTLRSDDRGQTLQVMTGLLPSGPANLDYHVIASAGDGSTVYYSMDEDVYRSTDGGTSRQVRGQLPFFVPGEFVATKLLVDPTNPQIVYATSHRHAYRSTDGGENWHVIWAPPIWEPEGNLVTAMTIDPQNPNRLWLATQTALLTSNDGVVWSAALTGSAVDVDVDPNNSQIVYAAMSDQTLMRTTDGGANWSAVPAPLAADTVRKRQLEIHPSDSARLYLFGPSGILASTDAGATWNRADAGIAATFAEGFSPTATASGHYFFRITGYGIAGVRPGFGDVDIVIDSPLPDPGTPASHSLTAVLSLPNTLIASYADSTVALSSDLGANWTVAATPPSTWFKSLAAAQTGTTTTVYGVTTNGLYRSDDLGNHWSRMVNGLPNGGSASASYITVSANQTQLYALVHTGGDALYRSTDGGQNWAPVPGTEPANSSIQSLTAHPSDAQTLLVGTYEGAYRTTDGGDTWQMLDLLPGRPDAPIEAIAIDPVNPNIIYISSARNALSTAIYFGNVFRSVDGGSSFQRLMPDYYPGGRVTSLKVAADQPHRIVAATAGNGVIEMSIEPDLELTLASQPGSATVNSPIEYSLTATNHGPFDATQVQVEVLLPAAASATTATIDGSPCVVASSVATCTASILRIDQTATIAVRTTPSAAGSFMVDAAVSGAEPDTNSVNDTASASVSVAGLPSTNPGGGDNGGGTGGGGGGGGSFGLLALIALFPFGLARRRRW